MAVKVTLEPKESNKNDIFFQGNYLKASTSTLIVLCTEDATNDKNKEFIGVVVNSNNIYPKGTYRTDWAKLSFEPYKGKLIIEVE